MVAGVGLMILTLAAATAVVVAAHGPLPGPRLRQHHHPKPGSPIPEDDDPEWRQDELYTPREVKRINSTTWQFNSDCAHHDTGLRRYVLLLFGGEHPPLLMRALCTIHGYTYIQTDKTDVVPKHTCFMDNPKLPKQHHHRVPCPTSLDITEFRFNETKQGTEVSFFHAPPGVVGFDTLSTRHFRFDSLAPYSSKTFTHREAILDVGPTSIFAASPIIRGAGNPYHHHLNPEWQCIEGADSKGKYLHLDIFQKRDPLHPCHSKWCTFTENYHVYPDEHQRSLTFVSKTMHSFYWVQVTL